jgi:hypothetical protein
MNLSAPTMPVFLISLILAILAVLGVYVDLPIISGNGFWIAVIAYIVLLVGNVDQGSLVPVLLPVRLLRAPEDERGGAGPFSFPPKSPDRFYHAKRQAEASLIWSGI